MHTVRQQWHAIGQRRCHCHRYCSVRGGAISLSTLATVNGRHPEGEFSVDKGYACGLLLENGGNLRVLEGHRAEKIILDQEGGLLVNGTTSAVVVDEGGELLVYPGGKPAIVRLIRAAFLCWRGKPVIHCLLVAP